MTSLSRAPLDPASLMARLARGDETALTVLLNTYWSGLVRYGEHLLGSPDAAQDLAQAAFVRLWERRARWRAGSAPRPILFRLVRNLAVDERRAARTRDRSNPAAALAASPPVGTERVEAAELREAIARALADLGSREREIVVLSRFHEMSRAEIAAVTGLSPGSVSNLLSIGMARLARALAPALDAAEYPPGRRMLRRA